MSTISQISTNDFERLTIINSNVCRSNVITGIVGRIGRCSEGEVRAMVRGMPGSVGTGGVVKRVRARGLSVLALHVGEGEE